MKTCKIIVFLLAGLALMAAGPTFARSGGGEKTTKAEKLPPGIRPQSSATPNFVEFTASAATIFSGNKPVGLLHFEYGLDIEGDTSRERIIVMAPRLRDAYGRVLLQYAGGIYAAGEIPDINYLTTRMQAITDRIIGKNKARFLVSSLMVNDH